MSDQSNIKKSLFVMFAGLFLGVSASMVGKQKRGTARRSSMGKWGKMSMGPRTGINNLFASSTRQNIDAFNINKAQVNAHDINGMVIIQQKGPVSIQNSENTFKTKNAALDIEIQGPQRYPHSSHAYKSGTLGSKGGPSGPKTQINNVDLSKTKQNIDAFNINKAQVNAYGDINGFVIIQQKGPVSIQNSENKFKSANLAARAQIQVPYRGHD